MKTKIRLLQSRPLLEDVVVNLKLDQNPKFLEVTERRSVWKRSRLSAARWEERSRTARRRPWPQHPCAAMPDGTRSRQESARLAPYVDVLAANMSAEPLTDTRDARHLFHAHGPGDGRRHRRQHRAGLHSAQLRKQHGEVHKHFRLARPLDARAEGESRAGRAGPRQLHARATTSSRPTAKRR